MKDYTIVYCNNASTSLGSSRKKLWKRGKQPFMATESGGGDLRSTDSSLSDSIPMESKLFASSIMTTVRKKGKQPTSSSSSSKQLSTTDSLKKRFIVPNLAESTTAEMTPTISDSCSSHSDLHLAPPAQVRSPTKFPSLFETLEEASRTNVPKTIHLSWQDDQAAFVATSTSFDDNLKRTRSIHTTSPTASRYPSKMLRIQPDLIPQADLALDHDVRIWNTISTRQVVEEEFEEPSFDWNDLFDNGCRRSLRKRRVIKKCSSLEELDEDDERFSNGFSCGSWSDAGNNTIDELYDSDCNGTRCSF